MNREKRTIFLVVLTLLAYGFSIFKDQGSFILPFPIFDFILIIVSIQFAFWNWRDILTFRKWYFYFYFLAILFKLMTNQILWSVILDDKDLAIFNETLVLDSLRLAYLILLVISIFSWSLVEKLKFKFLVPIIITIIHFAGFTEQTYWFSYISIPLFATYVIYQKPKNSLSYLLLLNGILDLLSLFMLTMVHWFYISYWYTASLESLAIFFLKSWNNSFWNLKISLSLHPQIWRGSSSAAAKIRALD